MNLTERLSTLMTFLKNLGNTPLSNRMSWVLVALCLVLYGLLPYTIGSAIEEPNLELRRSMFRALAAVFAIIIYVPRKTLWKN